MHFNINSSKIQNKGTFAQYLCAGFHALLFFLLLMHSRSLSLGGEGPAVFIATPAHIWVEAQQNSGERQIYDVNVPGDVEKMAAWLGLEPSKRESLESLSYISGQLIEVIEHETGNVQIKTTWMRAGKRMALGIPLHPDRMNVADWEDLAGIGPMLAQRIVLWRQKNGDYGSVVRLQQVNGVGAKKIASLKHWFLAVE